MIVGVFYENEKGRKQGKNWRKKENKIFKDQEQNELDYG